LTPPLRRSPPRVSSTRSPTPPGGPAESLGATARVARTRGLLARAFCRGAASTPGAVILPATTPTSSATDRRTAWPAGPGGVRRPTGPPHTPALHPALHQQVLVLLHHPGAHDVHPAPAQASRKTSGLGRTERPATGARPRGSDRSGGERRRRRPDHRSWRSSPC